MSDIEKLPLTSMDVKEEQIAKLKQHFPEAFTEGNKIDWDKLKLTLGESIDAGKERYGMNWPGKVDCFNAIQQPSTATLIPDREESVNFDTTENLFIEGDNLEVLKLLQKSYLGKIKMIYIDPPYNTGNDFIYPDNYSESLETYLEYTGQVDSEGRKFNTNTDIDGRFHSKWMNMMYPRLFLAKNLLREDGLIFISIDDNEVDNLKKICNEIFGEENFLSQIIIQSNKRGQTYKDISKTHEYLIVYTKSDGYQLNELAKDSDSLPYEDKYGKFDLWELRNRNPKFGKHNRPNLFFPIYVSPTSKDSNGYSKISTQKSENFHIEVLPLNSEEKESCWRWSINKIISVDLTSDFPILVAKQRRDGLWNIYEKSRKSTTKAKSIWDETNVINEQGTMELGELGMADLFDHPKPIGLLNKIVSISTDNNDIILDFFAGSCTTAHAILKLNIQDGGNRKFICVQLPEPTEGKSEELKASYKSIADISKERIRRVIKKVEGENKINKDMFTTEKPNLDLGFKVLRLSKSNFSSWNTGVDKNSEVIQEQLFKHVQHISPEAEQEAILYELLLKSGFELTTSIKNLEIDGKHVFSIGDNEMLICLEKQLTNELIKAIAELKPVRVICLDEGFQNNDQLKTNAALIMKSKGVVKFQTV
jgi:adenine-specific DNA-methyltransferase